MDYIFELLTFGKEKSKKGGNLYFVCLNMTN